MSFSTEQCRANWNKFLEACKRIDGGARSLAVIQLCKRLGDRMVFAPASGRVEYHGAYAGGLVWHSLNVLRNAEAIANALEIDVPSGSLVLCSLMHDLGKVGYAQAGLDYYLRQDSQWHRDKLGEMYKTNKKIPYMPVAHRSVFLLQEAGCRLSAEEFVAIISHDGQYCEENKPYANKEPMLASILMSADYLAAKQERQAEADDENSSNRV